MLKNAAGKAHMQQVAHERASARMPAASCVIFPIRKPDRVAAAPTPAIVESGDDKDVER